VLRPAVFFCGIVLGLASSPNGVGQVPASKPASDWPAFQKIVQPFLAQHCFSCHGDKQSGDVRLDQLRDENELAKGSAILERVQVMLRKRAMPPKKRPQPSPNAVKPVLAWLEGFGERMESRSRLDRMAMRRLNRAEYNNTIRDLLGVEFQPGEDFPADVPGHGFDNVASVLSVSPVLVEKYLAATEKIARTALFGREPMKPERTAHQPFFTADAFSKNTKVKFEYDETGMSLPSALHVTQRFPVAGEYRLRAILRGVRPVGSNPVELAFWIDGQKVHEAKIPVPTVRTEGRAPGELNGLWVECRLPFTAGEHWLSVTIERMYEGLPPAYKGPKPAAAISLPPIEVPARRIRATDAFFPMYLDVVGPYNQAKGPSPVSIRKIFGGKSGPRSLASVREILSNVARRAYRRPVTEQEVEGLVKLVERVQRDGDSLEEGLCLAIQQILISPHFLFRVEKPCSGALSPHELATRLSYFLWSSMPDEELYRAAGEGTLRQRATLEAQVRRMLKDDKAVALVENFGAQWLQTRALESHLPDRILYPEFTNYTRMSMQRETEQFFKHILRHDRSILDFLDADYTFLNQRLSEFYGIPGVKGHEFRKVDLKGTRRGGVWTQASVLTVSSYANRTSPVLRGKWILETLLNAPPPPPPPDVPTLDEKAVGKVGSLRQMLDQHRASPRCASCHARMDPLGFALEHFDAIGGWREKEGKFTIETAGMLPDGRSFKDHEELRALLKADANAFTEGLVEKMLIYALGRGLDHSDKESARAIADQVARDGYRFSSLVLGIVHCEAFQLPARTREGGR
jgi:mono/diheme cytochrome c family protein